MVRVGDKLLRAMVWVRRSASASRSQDYSDIATHLRAAVPHSVLLPNRLQMRYVSRRFRNVDVPRIAITVAAAQLAPCNSTPPQSDDWQHLFHMLDSRGLPATWAVVDGQTIWHLAAELLASISPHELAFVDNQDQFGTLVPVFRQQARLARRVGLPLRTMVSRAGGSAPNAARGVGR